MKFFLLSLFLLIGFSNYASAQKICCSECFPNWISTSEGCNQTYNTEIGNIEQFIFQKVFGPQGCYDLKDIRDAGCIISFFGVAEQLCLKRSEDILGTCVGNADALATSLVSQADKALDDCFKRADDARTNCEGNCDPDCKIASTIIATEETNINIYPNPCKAFVTISYDKKSTGYSYVRIYNVTGQMVFFRSIYDETGLQHENLELSYLPNGIYNIELERDYRINHGKLIIQK